MALGNNLKKQGREKKSTPDDPPSAVAGDTHPVGEGISEEQSPGLAYINEQVEEAGHELREHLMLIVFFVEKEEYALPIEMVSEVVKTPPIAPIPQVPDYIKGVANVRGNVVSILDIGLKMGLSSDPDKGPGHLMVIKSDEYKIAVGIDQVPNTLMVNKAEIDHSSELMLNTELDETYIKGIIKKDQRMIILIDILEMVSQKSFAEEGVSSR